MQLDGRAGEFVVIGENIHTTRVVLRKGRLVVKKPGGGEAVRFFDTRKRRRFLAIPQDIRQTQDYEEGRVKHVKIAVQAAMSGQSPQADDGLAYLHRMVQRQVDAGADYLDLNVDEVSLRLEEQKKAMRWLVGVVQKISPIPISVDSSNVETIGDGLNACDGRAGRPLLNSASLERLEALDLAVRYNARVVVTAAGESGMPQDAADRVANASRMVEAALSRGIAIEDVFVDALVFPISVDGGFGNHCFEAIRTLRANFGPGIHVTGGFSNVSFGLPCRRLINDVFTILAVEAGADSGIVDPAISSPERVFSMDRETEPYRLAEDMLLGRDRMCKNYLRAYRKGTLDAYR